jgi:hypothetical protein
MTITLYPPIVYENSLAADHGGSEVDEACEQIHDATKGWGVRTRNHTLTVIFAWIYTCFCYLMICVGFSVSKS